MTPAQEYRINIIRNNLTDRPKTAGELAKDSGIKLTDTQVLNAGKYIPEMRHCQVIRQECNDFKTRLGYFK